MRFIVRIISISAFAAVASAQPHPKTYSERDVAAMLNADEKRARLVEEIAPLRPDFEFSARLLDEWQKAGLSDQQVDALLKTEAERAIVYLGYLNVALNTYAYHWGRTFPAKLDYLRPSPGGKESRSAERADLIAEWLTSGHPGGNYAFVYTPGSERDGRVSSYTIVAQPLVWREGVRSFFTDETAVIRVTKENRAATKKDPPRPVPPPPL